MLSKLAHTGRHRSQRTPVFAQAGEFPAFGERRQPMQPRTSCDRDTNLAAYTRVPEYADTTIRLHSDMTIRSHYDTRILAVSTYPQFFIRVLRYTLTALACGPN